MPADSKCKTHTHKSQVSVCRSESVAGCRALQLGGGNREVTMVQKANRKPSYSDTAQETRSTSSTLEMSKNWKTEME